MCGIIAIAARRDVAPSILEGLKHLEYRGYDSAGIATIVDGKIARVRAEGKLAKLAAVLDKTPLAGHIGIGHTRWATHGVPNTDNAHPHATDKVAVVHNGIIENFSELRHELQSKGYHFQSQTDTEVVPVLITDLLAQGKTPRESVAAALARLHGAYALAIIFTDLPDTLFAARFGPPLAVGYGDGEHYVGSDAVALSSLSDRVSYLEDGDWAEITAEKIIIRDMKDAVVTREIAAPVHGLAAAERGHFNHYMQKEIFEQPAVVAETVKMYCDPLTMKTSLPPLDFSLENIARVQLVACGTSSYAAQIAKYWLEEIARIPTEVDIASEYRYRAPILDKNTLTILISQSGETADTLAVLRHVKPVSPVLAIVNVPQSSIAREAGGVFYTYAGPEIGVASTKAFTTQLAVLASLTIALAEARGTIDAERREKLCHALLEAPALITHILSLDGHIEALAHNIQHARDMLYIGRGTSFAVAMEGALKMKEISYIHAEAYAAGELKHGPIALIDEQVPVVVIAPSDRLFDKTISNLQEAAARGGKIILLSDEKGVAKAGGIVSASIALPESDPFISPLLYTIPIQLLAYHTAVLKGTDVDQPRNLAKSVTVE
ncbi:MAG: glutamine--fructose-6-phosphate transaminase (isomerizing) [Alphaproteobacteria bacterium]|nr:glutamine--fructose-6-phosphate transaminase (isomerizing) [Alphaproteobacteria bacterium]